MVVLGIGIGSFYPTATTAGVTSVDESQTSLAGGIVYMFQIAGGSIGLGLTTTVFSAADPFVDGIQAAFRLDAALSLVGFLIALFFVGGRLFARPPERRGRAQAWRTLVAAGAAEQRSSPGRRAGRRCRGRREQVVAGPAVDQVVAAAADQASLPAPPISLSGPPPPTRVVRRRPRRAWSPGSSTACDADHVRRRRRR